MNKPIIYNAYVRKRMRERGVSEEDIKYAVDKRDIVMPGKNKGRKRIFTWIDSKCLNLVIKETLRYVVVITVAWRGE